MTDLPDDWENGDTINAGNWNDVARRVNQIDRAAVPWIDGPIDFDTLTAPGVFVVAGPFLNGDATTYHQPGNTGMVLLTVTTVAPDPGGAPRAEVMQQYVSVDGANKGGQRRRYGGTWSGWMAY